MNKTKTLNVRCTEQEYVEICYNANERNMNLSIYMKECALNPLMPAFIPDIKKMVEVYCTLLTEINLSKIENPDICISKLEEGGNILCQLLK